jgi:hypothetical protein
MLMRRGDTLFVFKRKRSGNKSTLISIIIILAVIYAMRLVSPHKEAAYPDIIHYDGLSYIYSETVRTFPLMFTRKRPVSEEGFIILARRGISTADEVYIFEGFRKYRRYVVLKE